MKKSITLIAEIKQALFEENDVDKTHYFSLNARLI